MAEALIQVRGDLSDITEKFAQLRGQLNGLDAQTAAPAAAISERFKSLGTTIAGVGAVVSAVGGILGGFGIAAAKGAGQTAEQFDLLAQRTGLTTEQLRQLTPLFNRFNTDLTALSGPFRLLSKNFEDAAAGSEKAQAKFKDLGIEISASDRPIDVLGKVADAAARIGPGFERNAAMAALMGRGIATLVPILAEGSQGMAKSAEDAQRMGLMLGAVTEQQLTEMDDAFDDLHTASKAFSDTLGTAFAPVLLQVAQAVTSVLGAFNLWFQGLDAGTKQLVVVFTGVFAIGGPILVAVGAFMAALAVVTAPMLVGGAIVASVVAALTLIVVYWQNLKELGTTIWTFLTTTIVGKARAIYDGIMEWLVTRTEAIATKVQGFAVKLAAPFEWLADHLVGHSVVPDMVNAIGDKMGELSDKMGAPAEAAVARVNAAFAGQQQPERIGNIDRQTESLDITQTSAQRASVAATIKAIEQGKFTWKQAQDEMASVAVQTWGAITSTVGNAFARQLLSGNNWKETLKSLGQTVLSNFFNMGLQMSTQWILAEATRTAASTTANATIAGSIVATDATIVASNTAAAAVTTTVWSAAATAILGFFGTIAGGFTAIATGLIVAVTAVGEFIMGVLSAIAEALADTIFGIPVAALILAGVVGIGIALAAVPKFGDGGMVYGPTLALVGEKGPEIIAPLDKIGGLTGGGGGRQTINVYLDSDVILRAVTRGMPAYLELRGVRAV